MSKPGSYSAFLLGINIGPHRRVSMEALKKVCTTMGFTNVRTVLASGNVVFDAPAQPLAVLEGALEAQLQQTFGFDIGVIARPGADLQQMVAASPFNDIPPAKDTHCLVTFYTNPPQAPLSTGLMQGRNGRSFRILSISYGAVFSVTEQGTSTPDVMAELTKILGKKITTRNWRTLERLAQC